MDKRGISRFSVEFFCLTVPIKFIGEPFCVSKKIWYPKFSCIGVGHHGFVEKYLSHRTDTKNFVRKPFYVSEIFWYGKNLWVRRGYCDFLSKIFCPTVPKNFVREPFCVSKNFWYGKKYMDKREVGIKFLRRNFCCLTAENFHGGNPQCFRKIRASKLLMHKRAVSRYS